MIIIYDVVQLYIILKQILMTEVEIKSSDVIRLILQFLHQNMLYQSFDILQQESKITFNTISARQLAKILENGQWDVLLEKLNTLMLSQENLFSLYELIVDDLIQQNKFAAAQFLLKQSIDKSLTNKYRERVLRMEYICQNPSQKDLYKKPVTPVRKTQLIKRILRDIHEEPQPSRLLSLLAQSIKYQASEGVIKPNIKVSLYENKQFKIDTEIQSIIRNVEKTVQYSAQSRVSSLKFSNSGQYLAIGSVDGLIQIYDTIQYGLHSGLSYQGEGIMLFHQNAINNMCFNQGDEMLMSSDSQGVVKIWNIQTGKLLRKFSDDGKVSVISWGIDPSHILMGHHKLKLYGLRSSLMLKQYNATHSDQFMVSVMTNNNHIITVTTTCTIKIFHYTTQEQLFIVKLNKQMIRMIALKNNTILVCTSTQIIKYTDSMQQLEKYPVDVSSHSNSELLQCCGMDKYVYCCIKGADGKCRMNVIDVNGKVVSYYSVQSMSQMQIHPTRNIVATYDSNQQLQFWKSD